MTGFSKFYPLLLFSLTSFCTWFSFKKLFVAIPEVRIIEHSRKVGYWVCSMEYFIPGVAIHFRAILKLGPHLESKLMVATVKNEVLVDMIFVNNNLLFRAKTNDSHNLSLAD